MYDLNEKLKLKMMNSTRFKNVVGLEKTIESLLERYQPKNYTQLVNLIMTPKWQTKY